MTDITCDALFRLLVRRFATAATAMLQHRLQHTQGFTGSHAAPPGTNPWVLWQLAAPSLCTMPSVLFQPYLTPILDEVPTAQEFVDRVYKLFAQLCYGKDAYGRPNNLVIAPVTLEALFRLVIKHLCKQEEILNGYALKNPAVMERLTSNALQDALVDASITRVTATPASIAPAQPTTTAPAPHLTHQKSHSTVSSGGGGGRPASSAAASAVASPREQGQGHGRDTHRSHDVKATEKMEPAPATAESARTSSQTPTPASGDSVGPIPGLQKLLDSRVGGGVTPQSILKRHPASVGLAGTASAAGGTASAAGGTASDKPTVSASIILPSDSASQVRSMGVRHQEAARRERAAVLTSVPEPVDAGADAASSPPLLKAKGGVRYITLANPRPEDTTVPPPSGPQLYSSIKTATTASSSSSSDADTDKASGG
jgi:hypothetical protein